jgi:CMP/dCMP kinase
MNGRRIVAIDGAAGSGKSTLASSLARELGLPYVNTGLMYRAVTKLALEQGVSIDDGPSLAALTDSLTFRFVGTEPPRLEVEGYRTSALESLEVDSNVSTVARHPEVRARLRTLQRAAGEASGAVMEGRDIGSVVFPEARVKIYLVADPAVRGERRVDDREDPSSTTIQALERRDARDSVTIPFEPSDDAVVLDTSASDPRMTLSQAMAVVAEVAPELVP